MKFKTQIGRKEKYTYNQNKPGKTKTFTFDINDTTRLDLNITQINICGRLEKSMYI